MSDFLDLDLPFRIRDTSIFFSKDLSRIQKEKIVAEANWVILKTDKIKEQAKGAVFKLNVPYPLDYQVLDSGKLTEKISLGKGKQEVFLHSLSDKVVLVGENYSVTNQPEISFLRIDPTKYKVIVEKSTGSFYLVFSESFNPKWQVSLADQKISKKDHFQVNGYANAFFINQKGNFETDINYSPQGILDFSWFISITSIILCILIYLFDRKFKK